MRADGIYFVETDDDLRAVEELRYQGYIVDMKRDLPTADRARGRLPLPADDLSRIVFVVESGEVVGSLRIVHTAPGQPWPDALVAMYHPERFAPQVPLDRIVIHDTYVIRRTHRGGGLRLRLFLFAAQYALSHGVELILAGAMPHLLHLYRSMGLRTYGCPHFELDSGLHISLVLVVDDLEHLRAIASPLLLALELPGIRAPDVARGHALGQLIARLDGAQGSTEARQGAALVARVEAACGGVALFEGLDDAQKAAAVDGGTVIGLTRGEALLHAGRGGRTAFLILEGEVEVSLGGQLVARRGVGEVVGEVALFLDVRSADVIVATERATVLVLTERALLHTDPAIAHRVTWNLATLLARRLREASGPRGG